MPQESKTPQPSFLPLYHGFFTAFLPLFLFCIPSSIALAAPPKALLTPISFDPSTSLYSLNLGNQYSLLLDLAASNLWIDCMNPLHKSPTFQPVLCNSAVCHSAKICNSLICGGEGCISECPGPASPVCYNNSCSTSISNSAIKTSTFGVLWTDTFSILTTDGRNPGPPVQVPKLAFACGEDLLLQNKSAPDGVVGGAGLSRASIALPLQLASKLSLKKKFTYCLPGTSDGEGILIFGDSPIVFPSNMDFSHEFRYTPLIRDTTQPDSYFIGVKSISVNSVKLNLDPNLFKFKKIESGSTVGGVTISTTTRYTQLNPSIYHALASEFKKAANARGIKNVGPVSPFDTCFNASTAFWTKAGYNVPDIDIALQGSGNVVWSFAGENSVVSVKNDEVLCLAFQKTGEYEPRSVVIGSYQQLDSLFQYDLATSRLGFMTTLIGARTSCSNFNFTTFSIFSIHLKMYT